jgi:hypothetical protein
MRLYDLIVNTPEGIQVLTLYAANQQEALSAGKEQFSGLQLAVVLKQGEPGTELTSLRKRRATPSPHRFSRHKREPFNRS